MFDAAQNLFYRFLVSSTALKIKKGRLTYLSFKKLFFLEKAVRAAVKVPGEFLEAGVALGGTSVLIASHLPSGRTFTGYDVFGMIPTPTSDKDDQKSKDRYETIKSGQSVGIGGEVYYGYLPNLLERVYSPFEAFDESVSPSIELGPGPTQPSSLVFSRAQSWDEIGLHRSRHDPSGIHLRQFCSHHSPSSHPERYNRRHSSLERFYQDRA